MSKKLSTKGIDVTWNYDFQKKLRDGFSNKEWAHAVENQTVVKILQIIDKGISPVSGKRRFTPYSKSYKQQIDGDIRFFTNKSGKVYAVKPQGTISKTIDGHEYTPLSKSGVVDRTKFDIGLGKGKKKSPVNLTVEGAMLSYYEARAGSELMSIVLGIHSDAPVLEKVKAHAHNKGTDKIPARRIVPLKGESYSNAIVLEIRKLFAMILSKAINKKG
jgi:hypothetical protein